MLGFVFPQAERVRSNIGEEIDKTFIVVVLMQAGHIENVCHLFDHFHNTNHKRDKEEVLQLTGKQFVINSMHLQGWVCALSLCNGRGGILLIELQSCQLARSSLISRNK